jgi:lactoylglutathione lyase
MKLQSFAVAAGISFWNEVAAKLRQDIINTAAIISTVDKVVAPSPSKRVCGNIPVLRASKPGNPESSMIFDTNPASNVQQAVPFFWVSNLEASLRFYVDGLGFKKTKEWIDQGKVRWCWLELGGAAHMLQEYRPNTIPSSKRGEGVSICFQCRDAIAIYRDALTQGLKPQRPFVGNSMWVTIVTDPDGYILDFESPTDAPEESLYSNAE